MTITQRRHYYEKEQGNVIVRSWGCFPRSFQLVTVTRSHSLGSSAFEAFIVCKVVISNPTRISVCLSVCLSLARDSSENIKVVIINLGTVIGSGMLMHHVLIISTLTFIQGHTYLNHETNQCLIISETNKAMLITFAVKIVRLKLYMTIASPIKLTFIQGHKCVSNLTTF